MARLPDILGSLPPDAQKVYDRITAKRGKVGGPYVPLMHHHAIAERVSDLGEYLRFGSTLPGDLRELAILISARHVAQPFEWVMHAPVALKEGLPAEIIEHIRARGDLSTLPASSSTCWHANLYPRRFRKRRSRRSVSREWSSWSSSPATTRPSPPSSSPSTSPSPRALPLRSSSACQSLRARVVCRQLPGGAGGCPPQTTPSRTPLGHSGPPRDCNFALRRISPEDTRLGSTPPRLPRRLHQTSTAAAGDFAGLDQLHARIIGRAHEGDAPAIRQHDRPLEKLGAQPFETPDVRLDVGRVEAEVLEAEVGGGIAGLKGLIGAWSRDVHRHTAVGALAPHEAVPEDARLVVHDLEVEGPHIPIGGAPRIRRLQVDVIDPICHGVLLQGFLRRR